MTGGVKLVDEDGGVIRLLRKGGVSFHRLLFHPMLHLHGGRGCMPCQPSTFFHRSVFEELGLLDTGLVYAMDYDYWLRAFLAGYRFRYIPQIFSDYRFHPSSHSSLGWDTFLKEWNPVSDRIYRSLDWRRRRAADLWWCYLRAETSLLKRMRAAASRVRAG